LLKTKKLSHKQKVTEKQEIYKTRLW